MLRYWEHTALHQVYVSPTHLRWRFPHWKTPASLASSRFVARQAPDLGCPGQECGVVPVQRAVFEQFYQEISQEQARALDPRLVEYLAGLARQHAERSLKDHADEIQGLVLRIRGNDPQGIAFEVQGDPAPWLRLEHPLIPLTELLIEAQVFSSRLGGGRPLLVVPGALCAGQVRLAARLLSFALIARLGGKPEDAALTFTIEGEVVMERRER